MESSMVQEVKNSVSVKQYFYTIIVPQRADYYSDYVVDFDLTQVCKCPIHDESTPSMRYFDETNTFYCYGCRAGGDIIELHRRFTEVMNGVKPSFDESVIFLYNFFIKGNESHKVFTKPKLDKEEFKSTVSEIARFSGYLKTLDGQLLIDNSIDKDTKTKIWDKMDSMNMFVSKNLVNASEAMSYIKKIVRESIK